MKLPATEKPFTTPAGEVREDLSDAELDSMFANPQRFSDLPSTLRAKLGGRPKAAVTKVATTIRFDAEVIDAFRAAGPGWQSRMNSALRDWLKTHSPA